jgi:predicted nucleic acid-binding protein
MNREHNTLAFRFLRPSAQVGKREEGTLADGMIAATAVAHGLTLVARNTRDYAGLGVAVINPWED